MRKVHSFLLAGILTAFLCGSAWANSAPVVSSVTAAQQEGAVPQLLSPAEGAELDNGRTDRQDDIVWDFDWSDVSGATQYHLYVKAEGAAYPVIDSQAR